MGVVRVTVCRQRCLLGVGGGAADLYKCPHACCWRCLLGVCGGVADMLDCLSAVGVACNVWLGMHCCLHCTYMSLQHYLPYCRLVPAARLHTCCCCSCCMSATLFSFQPLSMPPHVPLHGTLTTVACLYIAACTHMSLLHTLLCFSGPCTSFKSAAAHPRPKVMHQLSAAGRHGKMMDGREHESTSRCGPRRCGLHVP